MPSSTLGKLAGVRECLVFILIRAGTLCPIFSLAACLHPTTLFSSFTIDVLTLGQVVEKCSESELKVEASRPRGSLGFMAGLYVGP